MPSEKLTDLQRAVIEHDDDMARLDRNTMPTPETPILDESAVSEIEAASLVERFKKNTWHRMNSRTINGSSPDYKSPFNRRYLDRGIRLEMSREQFYRWCERDDNKLILIDLHRKGLTPTIDRKDDDGHYCVTNIRIVDWSTNSRDGGKKGGDKTAALTSRAIKGVSLSDPAKVVHFASSYDAARNGFNQGNVTSCLTGKRKSAGGYQWFYQTNS